MTENFSKSIHSKILLLTITIITPVVIFISYLNIKALDNAKSIQIEQLKNSARLAATEDAQIIEGSRQLLITLSASDKLKNPKNDCSVYLGQVLNKYQRYNNIAMAGTNGRVLCSAKVSPVPVSISDRYFFKNTLSSKDFTIGEYSISKTTNEDILTFGYPVYDFTNKLIGVVYASLDLKWLGDLTSNSNIPDNASLFVLDRKGIILAGNPEPGNIGQPFVSSTVISELSSDETLIIDTAEGNSIYYFSQQIGSSPSSPYIVLGLNKKDMYKNPYKDFRINIIISAIILTVTVAIGWFVGNSLIGKVVLAIGRVDQLKRDFVSLVSHQLRTPLTAIKYFCEILLSRKPGKITPKQKEFLNDSLDSTNRLIFLVGTLLNISKLESGKIKPSLSKINLARLAEDYLSQIAPNVSNKKMKINIEQGKKEIGSVLADPKLISQVVNNFISNAVKYGNPGSKIDIKIFKKNGQTMFSVKNTGLPIHDKDKHFVYSKFFRTTEARHADSEGSGLGLYLSKLIVKAHGGKIGFTSSPQHGTYFFFTLPGKLR